MEQREFSAGGSSQSQPNIRKKIFRRRRPYTPNPQLVPWQGRRGARLQRGQRRGGVGLLREEREQGLGRDVGPAKASAKAGLLLLQLLRIRPVRWRHCLLLLLPSSSAAASSASARELRQQRAYHRRVHHVVKV